MHSEPNSDANTGRIHRLPCRAIALLGLMVVSLACAAAYTLRLNPEVRFYAHAARVKSDWAARLDLHHTNKVVFCGGSSAAFSINGERMLERHGLPLANFGLHAGMEPLFLSAIASSATRPGDTLLLAIEPGLLVVPFNSPDLAAQMGFALGRPRLIHASDLTGERIHWIEDLVCLRPGAYHAFTLLGKIALRKPLYRYLASDVQPSGWQRARERRPISDPALTGGSLSNDARRLLLSLKAWGERNRVKVAYSLPWACVSKEKEQAFQRMNAQFLLELAQILPVLKDPTLGAYPVPGHFADTEWHLTEEGAAVRTDALAAQLKAQAQTWWTPEELRRLAADE